MDPRQKPNPDILDAQIVEDDDGNMHIVPEEYLVDDTRKDVNPIFSNNLAVDNVDNDMPCSDVMDRQ